MNSEKTLITLLDEADKAVLLDVVQWAIDEGLFSGNFKAYQRSLKVAKAKLSSAFVVNKSDAYAACKRLKINAAKGRRERFMTPEKFK